MASPALHVPTISRPSRSILFAALAIAASIVSWGGTARQARTSFAQSPSVEKFQYPAAASGELPTVDGYWGIWYANQPSNDEYVYKYSGGKATYPHQHAPIAIYAPEANKTFFVYGGRHRERNSLLHMISYYDHKTGKVARPRVLLDKRTNDAHDNPTISLDDQGYVYVFSSSHGKARPSYVHRSRRPYDISEFDMLVETNFSYTQPWFTPRDRFVFMHTRYEGNYGNGRLIYVQNSPDGKNWSEPRMLAHIDQGHYQVTATRGNLVGTAFDYHPNAFHGDAKKKGLNYRTNIYYMQSDDGGRAWTNAAGKKMDVPLRDAKNDALAVEYESKDLICYSKGLHYAPDGAPVIVHVTSKGFESGPKNDPRTLAIAKWTGSEWTVHEVCNVLHNYNFAFLDFLEDGSWEILGDLDPGPQQYNTGGEIAIYKSNDQGKTWRKNRQVTRNSQYNHYYPRNPVNARPDFYALWADGDARKPSESRLYFCNREGTEVYQLPTQIEGDTDLVDPIRMTFSE